MSTHSFLMVLFPPGGVELNKTNTYNIRGSANYVYTIRVLKQS